MAAIADLGHLRRLTRHHVDGIRFYVTIPYRHLIDIEKSSDFPGRDIRPENDLRDLVPGF